MEHKLLVSTIEFFTQHQVEFRNAGVFVDESRLSRPLLLQADDNLLLMQ
jgi:hypothetical protein